MSRVRGGALAGALAATKLGAQCSLDHVWADPRRMPSLIYGPAGQSFHGTVASKRRLAGSDSSGRAGRRARRILISICVWVSLRFVATSAPLSVEQQCRRLSVPTGTRLIWSRGANWALSGEDSIARNCASAARKQKDMRDMRRLLATGESRWRAGTPEY